MHKKLVFSIGVFALWLGVPGTSGLLAQDQLLGQPAANRVAPDNLYPDASLTPGKADTVSVADLTDTYECPTSIGKDTCTYSQSHRNVSTSKRKKIYDAYNVAPNKRNGKSGEIDHFDPLCNGGSNDAENLWFQPIKNMWNGKNFGYKEKDDLEAWVCRQVKAGSLAPKVAFQRITSDWVGYYMEVNPKRAKFRD
jgi:hypothetical protein